MIQLLRATISLFALSLLLGCAGRDFVRPADSAFTLGHTTYSQIIEKMGTPITTGEMISKPSGKKLTVARYGFATYGGAQRRIQVYFFYDDVLVARNFTSDFQEDSSDWNEFKVSNLIKGKTTRAEAIEMLGHPSGAYIWTAVAKTSGEAVGYHHSHITSKFTGFGTKRLLHSKHLIITFDEKDRILDNDYTKKDDN
jgi:hypothetical protein